MPVWLIGSILAALFYGLHNIFTKLAAGKLPDSLGALFLETTAAVCIMAFYIYLNLTGKKLSQPSSEGIIFSILAGICVGIGTVLYFFVFSSKGELSIAGPIVLAGGILIMAIAGLSFFNEPFTFKKIIGIAFSLTGLILLAGSS